MKQETKLTRCAYIFGCRRATYGGARGFCPPHYGCYHNKVARGKITWDEIAERTLHHYDLSILGRESLRCRELNLTAYTRKEYPLMPEEAGGIIKV